MPNPQKISLAEFAQQKAIKPRIQAAFVAHLTSRGRVDFRTVSEWESAFKLFLAADRRRKKC